VLHAPRRESVSKLADAGARTRARLEALEAELSGRVQLEEATEMLGALNMYATGVSGRARPAAKPQSVQHWRKVLKSMVLNLALFARPQEVWLLRPGPKGFLVLSQMPQPVIVIPT
jgi:hypothetical protein